MLTPIFYDWISNLSLKWQINCNLFLDVIMSYTKDKRRITKTKTTKANYQEEFFRWADQFGKSLMLFLIQYCNIINNAPNPVTLETCSAIVTQQAIVQLQFIAQLHPATQCTLRMIR